MTKEEALLYIKKLKNKIIHTKSKKLKILYMNDLFVLQEFLYSYYGLIVNDEDIYISNIFESAIEKNDLDAQTTIEEFANLNNLTKKLSNGCINIFDKSKTNLYLNNYRKKYDKKFLNDLLIDFLLELDDATIEKYNEVAKKIVITYPTGIFNGSCWNIYGIDKQIINLCKADLGSNKNVSDIDFFQILAHELGHVVHFSMINKINKNKTTIRVFDESMSILFEKMFIDYLDKNNIDINDNLREEFLVFLEMCIVARAGSLALDNEDLVYGQIPDKYFSDAYFDNFKYIREELFDTEYSLTLPYFYGEIMATHVLDKNNNNYKDAYKELSELLIKYEGTDSKTLIDEIGIDSVPKGIARTLSKIDRNK